MALDFIRQNPLNDLVEDAAPEKVKLVTSRMKLASEKKLPKGKFSLLLGGNLLVWVFFIVMLLDLKGFSMNEVPLPIPGKLDISGIVYSKRSPHAIISNKAYGEGDVVDGWRIVNISRTEVRFEKDGKTIDRQVR